MLIARAPVRISFGGGGTDLPAYYREYGGMVVSATINRYFYTFLAVNGVESLQITSSDYRTFYRNDGHGSCSWNHNLRLPQVILEQFGIQKGVSLFLASEIPPGTGLGSSSTVAVAIIKAVSSAQGLALSRQEIAELACTIEIEKLEQPIGKQDQYAAAFGGLNVITFGAQGVEVEPLWPAPETLERLQRNLLLFFTGSPRSASKILEKQKRSSEKKEPRVLEALHAVREMADEVQICLKRGELEQFGWLLDRNWQQKKRFAAGVTNERIDAAYQLARNNGAIGGKISGAGGGGFLMLYCESGARERVTEALEGMELQRMDYRFENGGAQVLMNATPRLPVSARGCGEAGAYIPGG